MSSWIKLDQSFSKLEKRIDRNKRRDIVTANIEDDSSQEHTDLNFSSSSVKRRKLNPLENCTIDNPGDSSDECSDVDYNPDDGRLPHAEKRKIKPTLPFVASTALSHPPFANHSTSTNNLHSWKAWTANPKLNESVSCQIEESLTDDSDPASPISSCTPDTIIDESSTDSSVMQSQNAQQQETMIETQESITPPVAPFIATATNSTKKRKVRMVKGGMAEQLKKSLSQAKSNLLYWHHHRSAELISAGTIVKVDRVENTYGRILIHVKVNDEDTIFSLCSRSLEVREGDTIEVQFDVDRSHKTDTHVLYSYVDKVLPINDQTD